MTHDAELRRWDVDMQDIGTRPQDVKRVPHNIEAEQGLLGAILIHNVAYQVVSDFLTSGHFFDPFHGAVYDTIATIIKSGGVANPPSMAHMAETWGEIGEISAKEYLYRLSSTATINPKEYAQLIVELWRRRQLILLAEDVLEEAYQTSESIPSIISKAEGWLYDLAERSTDNRQVTSRKAAQEALDAAHEAFKKGGGLSGLEIGFAELDKRIGGLGRGDLVIVAGRPSMGKEQPLDSRILMQDGSWKEMGKIALGDQIASHDGVSSIVTGIFPQGLKAIFDVTFKDGRHAQCGEEHLWRVMYRDWDGPRVVTTAKLAEMLKRSRYQGRLWIDLVSGDFGDDHHDFLPVEPYLLGSLIANGSLKRSSPILTTPYAHIVERLTPALEDADCMIKQTRQYEWRITRKARIGAHHVTDGLKALGLFGLRSEDKFIPHLYLKATRSTRAFLLQGLMDGDGWVETFGAMRYGTSSYQLAYDIQTLVRSLGGLATISRRNPKYTHNGEKKSGLPAYVINMSFEDGTEFVSVPSKVRRISRKRLQRLTVKSVKPARIAEAQCITVSHPSQLYVTDGYVVTHNTALALNIAEHVAKTTPVAFFSMEMSAVQLATRMISQGSSISSHIIRTGRFDANRWRDIEEAGKRFGELPIYIDQSGGASVASLAFAAKRYAKRYNVGLIVVDYLQLMRGTGTRGNRVEDITEITTGLKALAKDLQVPVIALSQVNRAVESREDKRPQLSDLRESGSIEQDADVILFVFREEYYLQRQEPAIGDASAYSEWVTRMAQARGQADIIIGKQRNGPIGTVKLAFDSHLTRFSDGTNHGPAESARARSSD